MTGVQRATGGNKRRLNLSPRQLYYYRVWLVSNVHVQHITTCGEARCQNLQNLDDPGIYIYIYMIIDRRVEAIRISFYRLCLGGGGGGGGPRLMENTGWWDFLERILCSEGGYQLCFGMAGPQNSKSPITRNRRGPLSRFSRFSCRGQKCGPGPVHSISCRANGGGGQTHSSERGCRVNGLEHLSIQKVSSSTTEPYSPSRCFQSKKIFFLFLFLPPFQKGTQRFVAS